MHYLLPRLSRSPTYLSRGLRRQVQARTGPFLPFPSQQCAYCVRYEPSSSSAQNAYPLTCAPGFKAPRLVCAADALPEMKESKMKSEWLSDESCQKLWINVIASALDEIGSPLQNPLEQASCRTGHIQDHDHSTTRVTTPELRTGPELPPELSVLEDPPAPPQPISNMVMVKSSINMPSKYPLRTGLPNLLRDNNGKMRIGSSRLEAALASVSVNTTVIL